jgi:uncharacterized membrane protein
MSNAKTFFSAAQDQLLVKAIGEAEVKTSGEIRVHLENHCKLDPVERAWEMFGKLRMHQTEARNGVLFYLAVQDKCFAVVGDEGITQKVDLDFWDSVKSDMEKAFRAGQFVEGLCGGIEAAGEKLSVHFPHAGEADSNELSDELSIGD